MLVALAACGGDVDRPIDAVGITSSTVADQVVETRAIASPSTLTTDADLAEPVVSEPSTPSTVAVIKSAPVITIPPADAIEQAGIVGPLTLAGGCLYVDASEGGLGVVVFSHGTTWDPVTSSVVNPDGSSVAVGQTLAASGGGHQVADLAGWSLADGDVRSVQSCADVAGVTLFYTVGKVATDG